MVIASILSAVFLVAPSAAAAAMPVTFTHPIDAVSVTLPTEDATAGVRGLVNGAWTAWETLAVDNEQDPLLRESNLVVFSDDATRLEFKGAVEAVHPIDISDAPVRYSIAATRDIGTPRILSRSEWGADESLLYTTKDSSAQNSAPEENGETATSTPSQRINECEQAQVDYPNEFKVKRTEKTDGTGKSLRWAHSYSSSVKLIAVHHTAVKVDGDTRSGAERVRALYAYHANNRGWGDVGYHYLIDEDGQIYEGKSGGKYVVGGHAYCNNVGTVGVALLGNFEEEKPTQDQLKALQWLIADLGETYDMNLNKDATYHGKKLPAVVGHRDLVSTQCPGYYVYGALSQVLAHAAQGDLTASVTLPRTPSNKTVAKQKSSRATVTRASSVRGGLPRSVQRLLSTRASQLLRRKLGSNPGKEVEDGTASRLAARLNGTSVSSKKRSSSSARSVRPAVRSSVSSRGRSSLKQTAATSSPDIRIRLTRQENGAASCDAYDLGDIRSRYRGSVTCTVIDNVAALINTLPLEDYMAGLAEEPDTEPYEKQRAFAIAARTYAAYYMDPDHLRKFPGKPYDGSDSPATFQLYGGIDFENKNPRWVKAVRSTADEVLTKDGKVIRAPYFSADDGRTRTPTEAGWNNFPFAEIFSAKDDPWCKGETLRGHGVGMSGCGAEGQANEGKTGEEILSYYYPGTTIKE